MHGIYPQPGSTIHLPMQNSKKIASKISSGSIEPPILPKDAPAHLKSSATNSIGTAPSCNPVRAHCNNEGREQ